MAAGDDVIAGESVVVTYLGDGAIASLTLNRPARRNAIDRGMAALLLERLTSLGDDPNLRAVVLTGAGDQAFCAGADLIERRQMSTGERTRHTSAIRDVATSLAALPVPVIGAISGYALAGGAELALACDLRVGGTSTVFGFPEVKIGIFPGADGVVRLPRLIHPGLARELLYTGRQMGSGEALGCGLLDQRVENTQVMAAAVELARSIAVNAPLAIRALKQALQDSESRLMPEASSIVEQLRTPLDGTDDYREGLAAFSERRAPRFTGA